MSVEWYLLLHVLVVFVLTIVLSVFFGRWIRKKVFQNLHSDSRWDGTTSDLVLDYPKKAVWYASIPMVLLAILLCAVLIASIAAPEGERISFQILMYAVLLGLTLAGATWTTLAYRKGDFYMNTKGVGSKNPRVVPSFVQWDDIVELKMSPIVPNAFVLVTKTSRMKIPLFLNGMKDLASMLAVKIPRDQWGVGVDSAIARSMRGLF